MTPETQAIIERVQARKASEEPPQPTDLWERKYEQELLTVWRAQTKEKK